MNYFVPENEALANVRPRIEENCLRLEADYVSPLASHPCQPEQHYNDSISPARPHKNNHHKPQYAGYCDVCEIRVSLYYITYLV